jgi:hypothetical protein
MKPGVQSVIRFFQLAALMLLLILLSPRASAQHKDAPAPPPKSAPAPAPHPAPAAHPGGTTGAPAARPAGNVAKPSANPANTTGTANIHTTPDTNKTATGTGRTNKTTTGTSGTNRTTTRTNRTTTETTAADPRAPTGLNLRTANTTGAGNRTNGTGVARTNTSTVAGGAKTGALGAANTGNQPGTTKLANGGTKTSHANGSSVERNRNGNVTGVTTSKGATAKMDAFGKATSIHDGKGTTISRGPHGERRIETTRADHTKLVSNGKRGGYAERRFTSGGHEFAKRSYYYNGRSYTRVYAPYLYNGYAFYGYVPAFYYGPAFYGWAYNPWSGPVAFSWGWYGAPWYAPYGYYFAPYPVYPAPAFWLADYAIAGSLQAGAEEADSGSLQNEPGFVYASARVSQQNQSNGSPLVTSAIKDEIAEQIRQMIADEKDAAAKQGNAAAGSVTTPAVPPSLDPRFTLFIVSSELSLEAEGPACSITAGDIVRRKDYTPDGNNTVAVTVVSNKNGDCAVGTASRLKVDDLEEMHDNFREKVDDGLKSLSENQGKGGIPRGPAATAHAIPEGKADPDLTVESDLKKQQEAADETEKDVQDSSKDDGSAD